MATKRLKGIDLNIRLVGDQIYADGTVSWDVAELADLVPAQSIPVALTASAGDTIASLFAACDAAAEAAIKRGQEVIEKPVRPAEVKTEGLER